MSTTKDFRKVYRSKWYMIYFFLAGFDLLTILLSLLLNHSLVNIHTQTVLENRAWAERLTLIFRMSEAARDVNVAANDVFATNDIPAARDLISRSATEFHRQLDELESAIGDDLVIQQRENFAQHMEDARDGMQGQIDQANEMFNQYEGGDHQAASRTMAQMDRQNARIGRALADVRQEAEAIQEVYFQQQTILATRLRTMEYVLFVLVALMVLGATLYGTKLARAANAAYGIIENQRHQEAQRADRMSEAAQLATGVAHEMRNPLTSVKLLIQAGQRDGIERADLDIIANEVNRMERTLQSFLEYARPTEPKLRACDVGELVNRTKQLLQIRAKQQNVNLNVSGPTSLRMNADEDQIQQLLLNLCQNGLDAMPAGGTLTVDYRQQGRQIELRVVDTGKGIDSDIKSRLFEPFVSAKETGVGLGLVISRQIAQQHGGDLRLEEDTTKDEGAGFVVRIPTA